MIYSESAVMPSTALAITPAIKIPIVSIAAYVTEDEKIVATIQPVDTIEASINDVPNLIAVLDS